MGSIHPLPSVGILEAYAKRIHSLMEDWTTNSIAIGKELIAAQKSFPVSGKKGNRIIRPGWTAWVRKIGMDSGHASRLMRIAERFGNSSISSKTSLGVLKLLSRGTTPESARREVIKRLETGEKIGTSKAGKIVDSHRPKPAEANRLAKETGKAVLASDGYIYLGADKEDVKEATAKRTVIFAVRRAIETLAAMQITPQQMLDMAMPHQLLHLNDGNQINRAATWLHDFSKAWRDR